MPDPHPDKDILWKQFELDTRMYSEYLDLLLKFNVFYYAATGGLLSYYLAHTDLPLMKYSLAFPVLMSLGFSILFVYGAVCLKVMRSNFMFLANALGLKAVPEVRVLAVFLYISAALMTIVASALLVVVLFVNITPIKK